MKLIFDGDCGFCTRCAAFGKKRLKNSGEVDVVPWQSIDDLSQYGLTEEDTQQRIYFVKADGSVVGAAKALAHFGRNMKSPWSFFATILMIPPITFLAEPLYRLVARNRHHLPGSTGACRIYDDHSVEEKKRFLGLYIFLNRNLESKLNEQVQVFRNRELSYSEVGASRDTFPSGYNHDYYSMTIGRGEADFAKAVEGFTSWVSHRGAQLVPVPSDEPIKEGATFFFGFKQGPIALGFPDRIIYVNETSTLYECAYGTVQGHPEKGEEFFRIELKDYGDVVMTIGCYSRFVAPLAKIGYPVGRYLQKSSSRKYLTSLRDYVAASKT